MTALFIPSMALPLLVGLDLGTTHAKCAAYQRDGNLEAHATCSYPTYYPHPGWAEQCPREWQQAVRTCLSEVVARLGRSARQIAALGLSAHAPSLVPVDARGDPLLDRVPIWQDGRAVKQASALQLTVGAEWIGLGMPEASFAAKLKWFSEIHPELADQARYAMGAKAYLGQWLTGRYATDPSSEPGCTDNRNAIWAACNWSADRLVPIAPATEVLGDLRAELCRQVGLSQPVPVVNGLNDGACAVLGGGAYEPGEGVITLATNGVVFLVSDQAVPPGLRLERSLFCWPLVDCRWVVGGQTKTGAVSLQWLMGILKGAPVAEDDFPRLLEECKDIPPGSRGVRFLPYLMGRGTPSANPSARALFTGLSMSTNRADLVRAVLEGVAFALREILEELCRIGLRPTTLQITGGGARSALWRQIVAGVVALPLQHVSAESCLGAAMIAGVGTRVFPDVRSAIRMLKPRSQSVLTSPEVVDEYERLYREHCRLRDAEALYVGVC